MFGKIEARRVVEHREMTEERLDSEFMTLMAEGNEVQKKLGSVLRTHL